MRTAGLLVFALGCSGATAPVPLPGRATRAPLVAPAAASVPEPSAGEPAGETGPTPDGGASARETIDVPGFLPAYVVVPAPRKKPYPLIVVTHGAGGRPEPHCERYDEIVRRRAFILCTRGRPTDRQLPEEERGYFYDGHHELGKEVLAALDAAAARYGERLDAKGAMFAGYSQGASMGLLFLHGKREHAARFSRALLVEGGSADWNVALSARMREVGLDRVAIVCGQQSCKDSAKQSMVWTKRAGLDVRLLVAPGAGHTYGGAVAPKVEEAFGWLVAGDPRYAD